MATRPAPASPAHKFSTFRTEDELLDNIQQTAEKIVSLCKDRQYGMGTWWEFLYERMTEMETLRNARKG